MTSQPAAGFDQAPPAGRPRHRRQGRQDRRPRHQGPGRPRQHQARLRRRPAAAQAAHPEAEGVQEPVPGGVHVVNLDTLEGFDGTVVTPETLRAAGLVHKHGLVKVLGRGELTRAGERVRPRLLRARRRRPSRRPAAPSTCCPRRSATAGRPPRATRSPTAEPASGRLFSRRLDRRRPRPRRVGLAAASPGADSLMRSTFSNLKNMFRVPDLRNKVIFTLVIIACYRFGCRHPAARASTSRRCAVAGERVGARAACSASSTCSPAAPSPGSRCSGSGSCRTSRRRSSSSC